MRGGSRVSDIHFELTVQWLDWRSLCRGDDPRLIFTDNVKIRHCHLLGDMDSSRGVSSSIIDNSIVKLDQVPRWSDADYNVSDDGSGSGDPLSSSNDHDLTEVTTSRFPLDHGINSKLYLWRGTPWNLDIDAVVNSSNEVWTNLNFNGSHYALWFLCYWVLCSMIWYGQFICWKSEYQWNGVGISKIVFIIGRSGASIGYGLHY